MTNKPTIDPIPEDRWGLPDVEHRAPGGNNAVTAAMFARLLTAGRAGGWNAIFRVYAEGETITDKGGMGAVCERPARRTTLRRWLERHPHHRTMLDEVCQQQRDRLLNDLETEVEKIALGPGDTATDFGKNGQVTRVRTDVRNKLHAILKLLASHSPDTYADRRKVDVAGQIEHTHAVGNRSGYFLAADDVMSLPPAEQTELMRLLGKIEDARNERALPNAPRREVIDAPRLNGDTE